jgi:hypothetical protein
VKILEQRRVSFSAIHKRQQFVNSALRQFRVRGCFANWSVVMRRIEFQRSRMSLLAAAMVSMSAGPVLAVEEAPAPPSPEAAAEASKGDYYTRRAESVLEAEKSAASMPHPLAASYPGFDVVVCEAGCPTSSTATIVFARKEPVATAAAREGVMVPTSDSGERSAGESGVTCIAGCYDQTASAFAPPEEEAAEPWSTSVVPAPAPARAPIRDKLSPIR